MTITITEINTQTGEIVTYKKNETPQEQALRAQIIAKAEAEIAEVEARATAKADLLAKLGITQEEAQLLLS